MPWRLVRNASASLLFLEGVAFAQAQSLCIPGTPFCARANGNGRVQVGGSAQGQVTPRGVGAKATGSADANANEQANVGNNGHLGGQGQAAYSAERPRRDAEPIRFGAGVAFCGTVKVGVSSGYKIGPCFAVSFRTESITFEMETQLLIGGVRHSVDWVFPMSLVIPLTSQHSLYEGLQLRVGGSPVGVTFAKSEDGGNYLRFGLHAGLSYEYSLGAAASWRVCDARAFLDFGTKREADLHRNFLDFGGQLSTGIVF